MNIQPLTCKINISKKKNYWTPTPCNFVYFGRKSIHPISNIMSQIICTLVTCQSLTDKVVNFENLLKNLHKIPLLH